MEEEPVLPPMTGQPRPMFPPLQPAKSHDMPGVITVTGESGEHVLARIEPLDQYERQSTADMVLVQVCSMLDANGTLPGIQASCMCLKNQYGATLSPSAAIGFGQTVRLHGNKGKEEAIDVANDDPDLKEVVVKFRGHEYTMHVADPADKDLVFVTACDSLNLDASQHVLDFVDSVFTLRSFYTPANQPVDVEHSVTVKVPHLDREVRFPFFGTKSRRWAIVIALGMMSMTTADVSWDYEHDSDSLFDREVILLLPKSDKRHRIVPLTEEGADFPRYCFLIMPDGVTRRRILFKWNVVRANELLRRVCEKIDLNPDEYKFDGYDTDIATVVAGAELKLLKR